jgi:hypothetical protein
VWRPNTKPSACTHVKSRVRPSGRLPMKCALMCRPLSEPRQKSSVEVLVLAAVAEHHAVATHDLRVAAHAPLPLAIRFASVALVSALVAALVSNLKQPLTGNPAKSSTTKMNARGEIRGECSLLRNEAELKQTAKRSVHPPPSHSTCCASLASQESRGETMPCTPTPLQATARPATGRFLPRLSLPIAPQRHCNRGCYFDLQPF